MSMRLFTCAIAALACFAGAGSARAAAIDFGDDASEWARDGECDDKRFTGSGLTDTPLYDEDIGHDATDCRAAYDAGELTFIESAPGYSNVIGSSNTNTLSNTIGGVDFGDDASEWSNDGECDDKRFTGPGMTDTVLLDSDIGHDATDCRAGYDAGELTLAGADEVAFGDDASEWANDGECDDKRFTGPGMTDTILLDDDVGHDATDCRTAFEAGDLTLASAGSGAAAGGAIDFGDDASVWSGDGECDDKRFTGPGMTNTPLLDEDIGHDAADCRAGYEAGDLVLAEAAPVADPIIFDNISFGDDLGMWSNDDECDDWRFEGEGMTTTPLLEEDVGHDASDCLAGYQSETLTFRGDDAGEPIEDSAPVVIDGINFGDDGSLWSNDGECDDPRFAGPGMTDTELLDEDATHDATDCSAAYQAGRLHLKDAI